MCTVAAWGASARPAISRVHSRPSSPGAPGVRSAERKIAMNTMRIARFVRPALVGVIAMAAAVQAGPSVAQQKGRVAYDHLRTKFPLTGAHANTPCETCHVGGRMAGTPT